MNTKGHDKSIDIGKGIGIILVVLLHLFGSMIRTDNRVWFSPACMIISSFIMPLFFILSGILLFITHQEECTIKELVKKRAKSLLIPYFTFSICYIVIESYFYYIQKETTSEFLISKALIDTITFRGVSVLWFLPTLFISELLVVYFIKKLGYIIPTIILFLAGIVALYLSPLLNGEWTKTSLGMVFISAICMVIEKSILAAAFVMVGYHYARLIHSKDLSVIKMLPFGGLFLIFGIAMCFQNGQVDMNRMQFGNIWIFLVSAICNSIGIVLISKCLASFWVLHRTKNERKGHIPLRMLSYAGQNSLIIMLTHMDFLVLKHAMQIAYAINVYVTRAKVWVLFICIFMYLFIAEAILIYTFNHFLPFMIGKRWKQK